MGLGWFRLVVVARGHGWNGVIYLGNGEFELVRVKVN